MPRFIAFLRAVNVGGRHTVSMAELRGLFESLGFDGVETFIASGNVIFASRSRDIGALQRRIEGQLRKSLGFEVKTFIRTDSEVGAIARYKPFDDLPPQTAVALNVAFLAEPLGADAVKALMALKTEIDDFHVHGRDVYWRCAGKRQSESTFSNVRFEKILGVRTTFRGANTIARLAAKFHDQ